MQLLRLRLIRHQLEHLLEGFEVNLQVVILTVLHWLFLHLRLLVLDLSDDFFDTVTESNFFFIRLHILILHDNHGGLNFLRRNDQILVVVAIFRCCLGAFSLFSQILTSVIHPVNLKA